MYGMFLLADGGSSDNDGGGRVVAIGSEDGWLLVYDASTGLALQEDLGKVPNHSSAVSMSM